MFELLKSGSHSSNVELFLAPLLDNAEFDLYFDSLGSAISFYFGITIMRLSALLLSRSCLSSINVL